MEKAKLPNRLRMFEEGPDGFIGGRSAEKYIRFSSTSRTRAIRDLWDPVRKDTLPGRGLPTDKVSAFVHEAN